jgi:poly(beta-D-mannuronate) lyase
MLKLNILLLVFFSAFTAFAKDYPIHSAAELAALNLKPGDRALIQAGDWSNQQLVFRAKGTKDAPITLASADPGKILMKGNSSLVIDGQYLVVDGLDFTQGFVVHNDVIGFTRDCQYCRLTNTAIVDFNSADKRDGSRWVVLNGVHNRVDHCYLKGKNNRAATLLVWVNDKPGYNQVDHNFFSERPLTGVKNGTTIRIGISPVSMNDAYTTVEDNIFYHCNGDAEMISNRSGHNIIRNNLIYECMGTVTLREGNFAEVYGNYFIGNNVRDGGGICVVGEGHSVTQNYFQGLTGVDNKSAISLMEGIPNSTPIGFMQVKNIEIKNNTIVNCAMGIQIGAGKREERTVAPQNITLCNNLLLNTEPIDYADKPQGFKASGNLLYGIKLDGDLPDGFDMKDPRLEVIGLGIYQPRFPIKAGAQLLTSEQKLLFGEIGIGPIWYKGLPLISVK